MKFIFVLIAVIAAVAADDIYSADQIQKLKTLTSECETSSKVAHEKISEFRNKHFDDNDEHLKEYMFCVFKKLHWMDDEGVVQKDNIKKDIQDNKKSAEAMKACKGTGGSTPAEHAYNIYKCYMQHLPADYKYPL